MISRWLQVLCVLGLPFLARADGKVFRAEAAYARIPIPEQQALICFRDGVEHLVIETSFIASGTNFGWVVPVPTEPKIEASTRGLFPTLRTIFQPTMRTEPPAAVALVALVFTVAYFVARVRATGKMTAGDWVAGVVLGVGVTTAARPIGVPFGLWAAAFVWIVAGGIRKRRTAPACAGHVRSRVGNPPCRDGEGAAAGGDLRDHHAHRDQPDRVAALAD
jgi:hypothetical protein